MRTRGSRNEEMLEIEVNFKNPHLFTRVVSTGCAAITGYEVILSIYLIAGLST